MYCSAIENLSVCSSFAALMWSLNLVDTFLFLLPMYHFRYICRLQECFSLNLLLSCETKGALNIIFIVFFIFGRHDEIESRIPPSSTNKYNENGSSTNSINNHFQKKKKKSVFLLHSIFIQQ